MNMIVFRIAIAITFLAFAWILWSAHYKYENALICFTMIFIGMCYWMAIAVYWE